MKPLALESVARDSFFTKLDFRTKLLLAFVVTWIAFLWESTLLVGGLAGAMLLLCLLAGGRWSYVRSTLSLLLPFFVIVLLTHGFFNVTQVEGLTGRNQLTPLFTFPADWWLVGGAMLSREGVSYGLSVISRTLTLLLVLPLLVFTTDVDDMIVGLGRMGVPYKFAFIFSATLRFVPLLFDEAQTIIEAQRLRGLAVEQMKALQRWRVYARVAVPLILGSLVKSQQLEIVLQSKAFSGNAKRTYLHETHLRRVDKIVMVVTSLLGIAALAAYYGWGIGAFGHP